MHKSKSSGIICGFQWYVGWCQSTHFVFVFSLIAASGSNGSITDAILTWCLGWLNVEKWVYNFEHVSVSQAVLFAFRTVLSVQKIKQYHGGYSLPRHVGPDPRTDAKVCIPFAQQHSHSVSTVIMLVNLSFISRSMQENVAWLLQTLGHSQIFTSERPVTQPVTS